jgi:histidine kinase-like protein
MENAQPLRSGPAVAFAYGFWAVHLWGLLRGTDIVWVAVSDEGTGFTTDAPLETNEPEGGWGLALVDRIADHWAITPTASGTCAWFEIRYEL